MPVSIRKQAEALRKTGIDDTLIEEYKQITDRCKDQVVTLKIHKSAIESRKADMKFNREQLSRTSLFRFRRRSTLKAFIKADEAGLGRSKEQYKREKEVYKELVARRKEIRKIIRQTFRENKDYIAQIARERRKEKMEAVANKVQQAKDTVQRIGEKVVEVGRDIIDHFTPEPPGEPDR